MKLYENVVEAKFIERPNRFLVYAEIHGKVEVCHMPNPGRMRELLFPGVTLYATPSGNPLNRTAYKIIGVKKEDSVILLDTSRCNDVAEYLINHHKIPGWEKYHVVKREITMGNSRFDLLLSDGKNRDTFPVEVKSCTLFGRKGALFPDAVTARGSKHVAHLGEIGRQSHAGLLILVHCSNVEWFLPDFHTDIEFAQTFYNEMDYIDYKIAALHWGSDFTIPEKIKLIPTSKKVLSEEVGNHGDYLLVLHLDNDKMIEIGSRGKILFPKGFYVYVGTAKKNLLQRINRHRRIHKRMHWHIDYLRKEAKFIGVIPIRSKAHLEHSLAQRLIDISAWQINDFGSTDCHCPTHLFGFTENPLHVKEFTQIEEDFEINRLDTYFE